MAKSNTTEFPPERTAPDASSEATEARPGSRLRKRRTLTLSVPRRLEGLAVVALAITTLVFLAMSAHTVYQFPVSDGYRWYGDETWLLLAWKHLLQHGQMAYAIALHSTIEHSPGLFLGSNWIPAICYGLPQILADPHTDPITIGRTISFALGIVLLIWMGVAGFKLQIPFSIVAFAAALTVTTRAFTFATHSARYDMITGFAVMAFISFFAWHIPESRTRSRKKGRNFSFVFGAVAVLAGLTVSPHTGVLLFLPALFIAWYFGSFRSVWNFISLVLGAAVAFLILLGIYRLANGTVSILGIAQGNNQSAAYIVHIPIMRVFSASAQRHQLGAKLYYLWHEAPAFTFVLPLILCSEIGLMYRRKRHTATLFLTVCLALVLIDAALFQSTLPYYIVYFVPLAALTMAAHAREWLKTAWLAPVLALATIIVTVEIIAIWLPELNNGGRMGTRIDEANTAAVQAAVEYASRDWEPSATKPLVLAQAPALHELLRDTSIRVMSEAFLFYPPDSDAVSTDSIIARMHVNYIIDYNKPMTPEYEAAVRSFTPIFSRSGPLLDRTIDYFHDTASELDTLTIYEVDSLR